MRGKCRGNVPLTASPAPPKATQPIRSGVSWSAVERRPLIGSAEPRPLQQQPMGRGAASGWRCPAARGRCGGRGEFREPPTNQNAPNKTASQSEHASHRNHRGHRNCPPHIVTPPPIRPPLRGTGRLNQSARPSHGRHQQRGRGQRGDGGRGPEKALKRRKSPEGTAGKPRRFYLHVLVAELVDEHCDGVKRIVAVRRRHLRRRRRRPGSEGPYGAARPALAGRPPR